MRLVDWDFRWMRTDFGSRCLVLFVVPFVEKPWASVRRSFAVALAFIAACQEEQAFFGIPVSW